ncbi:hypothetical protein AGR8A_Cc60026 [Agrobacterium fabrum str. J-07]|nr:hypothetical protein AGR8A_Cc60026 [Agrobacterium fabrum str. J-07]
MELPVSVSLSGGPNFAKKMPADWPTQRVSTGLFWANVGAEPPVEVVQAESAMANAASVTLRNSMVKCPLCRVRLPAGHSVPLADLVAGGRGGVRLDENFLPQLLFCNVFRPSAALCGCLTGLLHGRAKTCHKKCNKPLVECRRLVYRRAAGHGV